MGQLDREGCNGLHQLLDDYEDKSIILVGQQGSFIIQSFDNIIWAIKRNGKCYLETN